MQSGNYYYVINPSAQDTILYLPMAKSLTNGIMYKNIFADETLGKDEYITPQVVSFTEDTTKMIFRY